MLDQEINTYRNYVRDMIDKIETTKKLKGKRLNSSDFCLIVNSHLDILKKLKTKIE